ncbi:hypothetical protein V6U90_21985 [Micromonospora sp. CPCC 206060]|uniref:hypothetical protein n=1 Tax=Micromonospora sp. CPCC 206060 TaxID=3122406 RepID=UPI002FF4323C
MLFGMVVESGGQKLFELRLLYSSRRQPAAGVTGCRVQVLTLAIAPRFRRQV